MSGITVAITRIISPFNRVGYPLLFPKQPYIMLVSEVVSSMAGKMTKKYSRIWKNIVIEI